MRPIPAPRLGDTHGLLRAINERERVRLDEFITDASLAQVFPPGLENAVGRTRQFVSFARSAGLLKDDDGIIELTEVGRRYVQAGDDAALFDVAPGQAEWLRRQLRERHMTDSIYHGAAIGLSLYASAGADFHVSQLDFGRALAYLGRAGWDNENTLRSQGERYTTFLRDLEVVDHDNRLTPIGEQVRSELTLPIHLPLRDLAAQLNPGGAEAADAEGEVERVGAEPVPVEVPAPVAAAAAGDDDEAAEDVRGGAAPAEPGPPATPSRPVPPADIWDDRAAPTDVTRAYSAPSPDEAAGATRAYSAVSADEAAEAARAEAAGTPGPPAEASGADAAGAPGPPAEATGGGGAGAPEPAGDETRAYSTRTPEPDATRAYSSLSPEEAAAAMATPEAADVTPGDPLAAPAPPPPDPEPVTPEPEAGDPLAAPAPAEPAPEPGAPEPQAGDPLAGADPQATEPGAVPPARQTTEPADAPGRDVPAMPAPPPVDAPGGEVPAMAAPPPADVPAEAVSQDTEPVAVPGSASSQGTEPADAQVVTPEPEAVALVPEPAGADPVAVDGPGVESVSPDVPEAEVVEEAPAAPVRRGSSGFLDLAAVRAAGEDAGLALPESVYAGVVAALASGKHVVICGPAGSGKTTLALAVARAAEEADRSAEVALATASPKWSAHDTVGRVHDGGFSPGHVLAAAEQGRWLVVDELDRAKLDKAFGDLSSFLGGQPIRLPDGSREIAAPADWRIVATRDTGRGPLEASPALLRRFAQVHLPRPERADLERAIDAAARGDATAAAAVRRLLDADLPGLGAGVFIDGARHAAERNALCPASEEELADECMAAYIAPHLRAAEESG